MLTIGTTLLTSAMCALAGSAGAVPYDPPPKCGVRERPVDVVICLDTSGSMTGLIDSARAKLWEIVNEVARSRPAPRLRVGLLTYGTPCGSTAGQGWIKWQSALTTDLDSVYSRLMALSTSGGDEYVGWVLQEAVTKMDWSCEPNAVRMIFVAGNESADQAVQQFNFRNVASSARFRGITVNAIYAGHRDQGIRELWDQVAEFGGGTYGAIDMNRGTIQIATPYDKILIELNAQLNATYIPYGADGRVGQANQQAQDGAAAAFGDQTAASRFAAKATGVYRNERWDLVDADRDESFDLASVAPAALPAEMQSMTVEARKAHVHAARAKRDEVQRRIQEVSGEREQFLHKERARQAGEPDALDDAMRVAIRRQLAN